MSEKSKEQSDSFNVRNDPDAIHTFLMAGYSASKLLAEIHKVANEQF